MRRLCGALAAAFAFATMAAPAGAQEVVAPEAATLGLCTAHFFGIPEPTGGPADAGLLVAHFEAVPEPTAPCP